MPEIILYCSNTGFSARYAQLLSEKTGLPALPLAEAEADSQKPAILVTWVKGYGLQSLEAAQKAFDIKAVLAVGMNFFHKQVVEEIRKANGLKKSFPLFYAQGGFDKKKLKGMDKVMLTVALFSMKKALQKKADRSPEETDMLALIQNGGSRVSEKHLKDVLSWLEKTEA